VDIAAAHKLLANASPAFPKFYGPSEGLDWGVGLIVKGVAFPFFDKAKSEFSVGIGRVYVVSHECDIDLQNNRPFNDMALLCPIIPLEAVLERYLAGRTEDQSRAFVDALGKRTVDRAAYIPTISEELPYGGVLYFNSITHTHVSEFHRPGVEKCCSLSGFGLVYMDAALSHAVLKRPKAQALPLSGDLARWSESRGYRVRRAFAELQQALREWASPRRPQ
jgi:hypothetical protein